MEKYNYLTGIISYLEKYPLIKENIFAMGVHPGKTGRTVVARMQEESNFVKKPIANIYLLSNEISETTIIETEQNDIMLQGIAYLLVLNAAKNQSRSYLTFCELLEFFLGIVNNQRWNLSYTFPTSDITAMDLYGLSYDSEKLAASEGWDPTIQAYAKDLYQTDAKEAYPKNLTLWFVSWKQKLRIGENIFLKPGVS